MHRAVLLKKFVMSGVMWEEGQADPYEHVASIVTNVTRLKEGRELLLQPGRGLLQALASQLRAQNPLRRKGAAGAIKNCCMTAEVRCKTGARVWQGRVGCSRVGQEHAGGGHNAAGVSQLTRCHQLHHKCSWALSTLICQHFMFPWLTQ